MRLTHILFAGGLIIALMGTATRGQTPANPPADNLPPTDRVKVFTMADLGSRVKGEQPSRLLEGGDLFSLNLLHRKTEPATVHLDLVDLYFIQEGSGTLESGGTILDPKPAARAGDLTGSGIRGGTTQAIKKGDVVFIPPGVPHRFIDGDIWYLNAHFPVKKR